MQVFAERGFYHARVSEVAAHAGVAGGTIYNYFRNKDDLLISGQIPSGDELMSRSC